MKKNLEKIFASASIVVAVILIMVLIVTAFGGIKPEEFKSELVQGLLITLAILYFVLAVFALILMFINNDVIKEVVIRTETGGSARVSSKVINKYVKQACAKIEGVKCKKVILVQDDYGVRLKVNVKIVDKDVIEAETYLRTLLEDMFFGEFGFKFESIEIKVMALTPKYKSDKAAIEALVAERVAEIKAEQAAAAPVKESEPKNAEEVEESLEAAAENEVAEQTDGAESANAEETASEQEEEQASAESDENAEEE